MSAARRWYIRTAAGEYRIERPLPCAYCGGLLPMGTILPAAAEWPLRHPGCGPVVPETAAPTRPAVLREQIALPGLEDAR